MMEVKDEMSLKDDTEEIRLYNIPNPRMIIGHVVKPNIPYITDLSMVRSFYPSTPSSGCTDRSVGSITTARMTHAGNKLGLMSQATRLPRLKHRRRLGCVAP
jgi:hypothetical protein